MNRNFDNKRPIEQILVGKAGANTEATGQAGGETLIDSATGLVNLNEGEIFILSSGGWGTVANNVAIAPADTVAAAPEIFLVRGNENAGVSNPTVTYPLNKRPYEKTAPVNATGTILYNYKAASRPTFDTWVVGATVGSAGAINLEDESEYALKIAIFGRDADESHAAAQKPDAFNPKYISKDYTTLGHSDAEATDDIIQHLVYDINLNSKAVKFNKANYGARKPVIAFAIDSTGANGINPRSVTPGTNVPVMNTNIGLRYFTFTRDLIDSFVGAASDLSASATIVPVDLSLAGDAAAAGTALTSPSGGSYSAGYTGTITFVGNINAADTVTVGTKTYTFEAAPAADGDVDVGATAAESAANLVAAINLAAGAGTAYHASTVAQPEGIRAQLNAAGTVITLYGSAGSALAESTAGVRTAVSGANLTAVNVLSGKADQIVLLALDRDLAFEDRIPYVKTRIEVGLLDGFDSDTVTNVRVKSGSEGQGTSRQLQMHYDNTARQRQYDQYRGFEELKIRYPNPVEDGVFYDQVTVTHYHSDKVAVDTITKPFNIKIWIPNAENADTGAFTPDANQVALVTGVLKPWIDSTSNPVTTS